MVNMFEKSGTFQWHSRFKEGREHVQDGRNVGSPKTQSTNPNLNRISTLVRSDRRLGARLITEELNMIGKQRDRLLWGDLGTRNFRKFGASNLTDDQKSRLPYI
jgi:hypothetical protein